MVAFVACLQWESMLLRWECSVLCFSKEILRGLFLPMQGNRNIHLFCCGPCCGIMFWPCFFAFSHDVARILMSVSCAPKVEHVVCVFNSQKASCYANCLTHKWIPNKSCFSTWRRTCTDFCTKSKQIVPFNPNKNIHCFCTNPSKC
jgi:hypothetical protein